MCRLIKAADRAKTSSRSSEAFTSSPISASVARTSAEISVPPFNAIAVVCSSVGFMKYYYSRRPIVSPVLAGCISHESRVTSHRPASSDHVGGPVGYSLPLCELCERLLPRLGRGVKSLFFFRLSTFNCRLLTFFYESPLTLLLIFRRFLLQPRTKQ